MGKTEGEGVEPRAEEKITAVPVGRLLWAKSAGIFSLAMSVREVVVPIVLVMWGPTGGEGSVTDGCLCTIATVTPFCCFLVKSSEDLAEEFL